MTKQITDKTIVTVSNVDRVLAAVHSSIETRTFKQLAAKSYKEWQDRMAAPPADSSAKRALRKLGIKTV